MDPDPTPREEKNPLEPGAPSGELDPLDGLPVAPAPQTKTEVVRAWIKANPDASIAETVRDCPARPSRGLVSIVRRDMGITDGLAPRPRTPTRHPDSTASPAAAAAASPPDPESGESKALSSIFDRVLAGEGRRITPHQQAALLSEMAISPVLHPQTRVTALNSLRALESATAEATARGPGVPLTAEDKVDRLSRLFSACGRAIVRAAFKRAFSTRPSEALDAPDPPAPAAAVDA